MQYIFRKSYLTMMKEKNNTEYVPPHALYNPIESSLHTPRPPPPTKPPHSNYYWYSKLDI